MSPSKSDITFAQRISRYPSLKNRIELLMNIIDDSAGDCQKANAAEMRVIGELRQMGSEALHCWAEHNLERSSEDFSTAHSTAVKSGKKTLVAYHLRRNRRPVGGASRPFSVSNPTVNLDNRNGLPTEIL
jgi:hypothetical protein